jgi:hypothetical protein
MTIRKYILSLLLALIGLGTYALPTDTIISMETFYPGADVYELEGHSAIRVTTPREDVAVSYGMFDFNSPNFIYRFVKGETDYWVAALPWAIFEQAYTRQGRRIVEQQLNITAEQKNRLIALIKDNLQPQNRVYRYNYVKDNCATRPLNIVEAALGDSIVLSKPTTVGIADNQSFRSMMTFYHRNYPWYQFGIDLALGNGIDYTLANREKAFAPIALTEQLENATVGGKKLVAKTNIINDVDAMSAEEDATPWMLTPVVVFTILLLIVAAISVRDVKRKRLTASLDSIFYGVIGVTSLLLTFLIFVSTHEATSPNWLYLWINPLCFIAAVGVWIKPAQKLVKCYQIINFALLLVFVVVWICGVQHFNIAILPIVAANLIRSACFLLVTQKTN